MALRAYIATRLPAYTLTAVTASGPWARSTRRGASARARPPPAMWLMLLKGSLMPMLGVRAQGEAGGRGAAVEHGRVEVELDVGAGAHAEGALGAVRGGVGEAGLVVELALR